jgi:hypothetical protein
VDPVRADLDTTAALDALSCVAPDPVLAQGILEPGRGGNGLPGLARGPGLNGDYFLRLCHIWFSVFCFPFSVFGYF